MRLPNKTEIIISLIVILLILIPYIEEENELLRNLGFFISGLLAFRFLYPINIYKVLYVDFSKFLNVIIWSFIVLLIYFTDEILYSRKIFSVSNGLILIFIYSYFIVMRTLYFLIYKRQPIWYNKFSNIGDYDECVNRKVDKIDRTFTWIYLGFIFFGILVMINI